MSKILSKNDILLLFEKFDNNRYEKMQELNGLTKLDIFVEVIWAGLCDNKSSTVHMGNIYDKVINDFKLPCDKVKLSYIVHLKLRKIYANIDVNYAKKFSGVVGLIAYDVYRYRPSRVKSLICLLKALDEQYYNQ